MNLTKAFITTGTEPINVKTSQRIIDIDGNRFPRGHSMEAVGFYNMN
ncbi:hypothetical protein [Peribacillus simplex]